MADEADILRIMIATDNHLGVWEKDEVRRHDSFAAFDEVFEIAEQQRADLVLLGGDLFHDNKPSRQTVVKAMEILSRRCLGDRAVAVQVLSDPAASFASGRVNFHDPNHNIALPVFTIHGNHDDPAGQDNLSAVDILSTASLVNYFGKAPIQGEGAGKVRVAPVLLQKGATRLALYGLGNLRDERLCRLFNTPNSVEWVRPAPTPAAAQADWFNVFVLHQNRVAHAAAAKNCVREGHLARFLDLVVWGHEHECLADPWESVEGGGAFSVMQPGSSVATALSEGEARRKHCVLLEVAGGAWRTVKFPLESVRPFAFDNVTLSAQVELEPEDSEGVTAFLERRVAAMIEGAARERGPRTPELPLVRLRVDYTGFSTINTQRFGQKFVGKVANPHDIILWQKAAARRAGGAGAARDGAAGAAAGAGAGGPRGAPDEACIEDLIGANLQHNMEILPEAELTGALREFVDKDLKTALTEAVCRVLAETQAAAVRENPGPPVATAASTQQGGGGGAGVKGEDADLVDAIAAVAQRRAAAADSAETLRRAAVARDGAAAAAAAAPAAATAVSYPALDDDDMAAGPSRPAPRAKPPRAPPAKAAPKPRGRAAAAASPLARSQPAAPRGASARAAASAANKKLAAAAAAAVDDFGSDEDVREADLVAEDESSEDAIEDSEMEEEEAPAPRAPAGRKRGRGAAPAAQRAGAAAAETISLLDSDEDEQPAPSVRGRRAPTQAGGTGRSQPFGGLGTGTQGGWGALK